MTKIGLVLSGGGAYGFAHVGALKVIEELGIKFDAIAGCSMGSIIGAFYAAGKTAAEIEELIIKKSIYHVLDPSFSHLGINETKRLQRLIEDFSGAKKFEQLKTPLFINSTNLSKGEEVVFSSGELFKAIRASIAVPGIFAPQIIDGDYYVDGGVLNNVPASILPKDIDKYIIIDAVGYTPLSKDKKPRLPKIIENSGSLAMSEIIKLKLEKIPVQDSVIIVPCLRDFSPITIINKNAKAIMDRGEAAALKHVEEIKRKLRLY